MRGNKMIGFLWIIIAVCLIAILFYKLNDGNKRTAMLIANHEMIKNGKGVISIAQENKTEFGEKLIKYYETDEIEDVKQFIYDKCIYGIEPQ